MGDSNTDGKWLRKQLLISPCRIDRQLEGERVINNEPFIICTNMMDHSRVTSYFLGVCINPGTLDVLEGFKRVSPHRQSSFQIWHTNTK